MRILIPSCAAQKHDQIYDFFKKIQFKSHLLPPKYTGYIIHEGLNCATVRMRTIQIKYEKFDRIF